MGFKSKAQLAAEAEQSAPEETATMPETTIAPVTTPPVQSGAPTHFTVLVEGLVFTPPANRQGITGRQYTRGQFYPSDIFLRNEWKKNKGTVRPYTGDPTVQSIPLHATPNAPYQWTDPETEEAPDLWSGEDEIE